MRNLAGKFKSCSHSVLRHCLLPRQGIPDFLWCEPPLSEQVVLAKDLIVMHYSNPEARIIEQDLPYRKPVKVSEKSYSPVYCGKTGVKESGY